MDAFPSIQTNSISEQDPQKQSTSNGVLSTAERLMLQHQTQPQTNGVQHLSYEEMRASPQFNGVQPSDPINHQNKKKQPDMDSETAFPSLGTPAAAPKTSGGWGSGPALSARVATNSKSGMPTNFNSNVFTETLVLFISGIHIGPVPQQFREKGPRQAGEKREEDPKTLPDVLRAIQRRHPTVSVESSTSRDRVTILFKTPYTLPPVTSSTPPLVKAASGLNPEDRIVRARQELITRVTRKIEKIVMVPAHVKPYVIGQKGRVLKNIIESTGASVNLPPKDDSRPILLNQDQEPSTEEIEMIPITINGEESAVLDAEDRIKAIVKERSNKVNLKVESIPIDFYPILDGPSPSESKLTSITQRTLVEKHGIKEEDLNCRVIVPSTHQLRKINRSHICLADEGNEDNTDSEDVTKSSAIVVSGEREQVDLVIKLVQSIYDDFLRKTTKVEFELPKRQHRFLDGQTLDEILSSTGSIVALPPANDPSEKVLVRGEKMANVQALGLVMTAANAKEVDCIDLKTLQPNSPKYHKEIITYLSTKSGQTKLKQIQDQHKSKVQIYVPLVSSFSSTIELVGMENQDIQKVKDIILTYIKTSLKPEYFESIEVDYLLHRFLLNKKNLKLKTIQEQKGIEIIIPNESEKRSSILLCGSSPKSSGNHQEMINNLKIVKDEISKVIKELDNIQTISIEVDEKFHSYIQGPNRTTLNAIIGEEKLVSVEVGSKEKVDLIKIRGPKNEVERVEKEIKRIAEEAKVNDTINSFTTEFEVESKHVSHLVGKGGSTVAKLREELGVRVDFSDGPGGGGSQQVGGNNENESNHHRKKKTMSKVSIVIQGRKENVEEAKKRILAQAERLADEITISLPLLSGLDRRSLIGKGGKYVTRLQDVHLVRINMPRAPTDESGASVSDGDNIVIRGPKKGVDAVRKELIELMEYEKENGNTITLTISTKSISRIVGKGGIQADKIKEESGIGSLDIDKSESSEGVSKVLIKGTKSSILLAKKMINSIVQEVDDEGSTEIMIEKVYHQTLIGKGGSKLREIVKRAGGDEDDAKMVKFPRTSDSNQVIIKGSKKLIPKIKEQLEIEVNKLKSQIVWGLQIPKSIQPGLIGRGAIGLKTLQNQFGILIHAPGWREWSTVSEPINLNDDLKGVEDNEIFKLVGTKEACLAAAQEMKSKAVPKERVSKASKTVMVPKALHNQVSRNGRLFRELPKAIRIDHSNIRTPQPFQMPTSVLDKAIAGATIPATRIDMDEEDAENQMGWNVQEIPESKESEDGEIPWNIHGPNEEEVEKVSQMIQNRIKKETNNKNPKTKTFTHLAIAKVPVSLMPRIIGRGGNGLRIMNEESDGAMIDVIGKVGSDSLSICGSLEQLEIVKKIIIRFIKGNAY
ncbi:uncharacterized protein MELLADRAFT_115471 [Melampsora larici-populina 98AG31]|uniref:K Homology domain-containing protein n=1 Tax=Melampsora larici-populina (strain 98AG31 / pathotype 3-4-7) TaxID=747676 RepID=F4RAW1_MELLP|nr:uncharacterized protein MELLADRAFT_115471 [Melampsora larici-populina 98AG31]EGG10543.1 hypothetical protein MELLADRAFT_115471 [Melampsora larici-populina 98AG31]